MKIIKKDGSLEDYNEQKIINACNLAADRSLTKLTSDDFSKICNHVIDAIEEEDYYEDSIGEEIIPVKDMHVIVESVLSELYPKVGEAYRQYRNYKVDFVHMLDRVYQKEQEQRYIGDNSNANTDSTMVSTQRSLSYGLLSKELYRHFFLTKEEIQASNDGYIYIHDMKDRRDAINCCLFDMSNVLKDGFEMGNIWYNEPKTLDVAFDVISDVAMSAASQQYGGFTIPRVDTILVPYAEKSYKKYKDEFYENLKAIEETDSVFLDILSDTTFEAQAEEYAIKKVYRDMEQGFQSWEYRFNTVASSRGDYPFISASFGLETSKLGALLSKAILNVREKGQGKEGRKKPVLFPKLTFLYDKNLHGEGKELHWLFEEGVKCSMKTMYPDWLSLTGEGYIPSMYKKYGKVVSLMGCVDGKELITYKFKNKLYVESFKRCWERLSKFYLTEDQIPGNSFYLYLDTSDGNVEIFDTKKGMVKVKKVVRNISDNWVKVKFEHGRQLSCTEDHPLPTNRGRVFAKDLTNDDVITINTRQYSQQSCNHDSDEAMALGFVLHSEQHKCNVKKMFTKCDNKIAEKYVDKMKKFGADIYMNIMCADEGDYKNLHPLIIDYFNFQEYLMSILEKAEGSLLHIPNKIFTWDTHAKLSLLTGIIDADRIINPQNHDDSTIRINSTDKGLSLQHMALIQSLGMPCAIYENDKKDNKVSYEVEFTPNDDLLSVLNGEEKDNYEFSKVYSCCKEVKVISVEKAERLTFSYDVETESDHFEVSGIYSHNCRASLSPWYVEGGMHPANDKDEPIFEGRFNLGAISLHLPMILAKSRQENKDFYEVLDYYLELIRNLHKRTYNFLGEKRASTNPLGFTQGGFLNGNLEPNEKIKKLLPPMTMSFGITALNELQRLYNEKSIYEDGEFALEVMEYINEYVNRIKEEDHILYAIYGTPAESLCSLQVEQFRKKYGIIENVSDKEYVSNSFHCHVSEDITPIEKQDSEVRFWNLLNGGKIQYCRYPIAYNKKAVETLIERAMDMGLYEGVNMSLAYCEDCGYEQLEMDECPKCGSKMITKIDRMNGYLGYTRVHGKSRYNSGKQAEIKDRKSM